MRAFLAAWRQVDPVLLVWNRSLYERVQEQLAVASYLISPCACLVQLNATVPQAKVLRAVYPCIQGVPTLCIYVESDHCPVAQELPLHTLQLYTLGTTFANATLLTPENMHLVFPRRVQWHQLQEERTVPADFDVDTDMPPFLCSVCGTEEAIGYVYDCPLCEASCCSITCRDACGCVGQ